MKIATFHEELFMLDGLDLILSNKLAFMNKSYLTYSNFINFSLGYK